MALATRSQVKTHLGIPTSNTQFDSQIDLWLASALSAVVNYCGTSFEQATRTEYYEPDGYVFVLQNRPVISVTSVYEDPNGYWGQAASPFPATTLLTAGEDYALQTDNHELAAVGYTSRSGILRRIGQPWARRNASYAWSRNGFGYYQQLAGPDQPAIGCVKVTYVSGYATVPSAVTQAVLFEVDAYRQRAGKGGAMVTAESLGEYSYNLGNSNHNVNGGGNPMGLLSEAAINLLAPFKVLGGGLVI